MKSALILTLALAARHALGQHDGHDHDKPEKEEEGGEHDGHDHGGGGAFEWVGVFELDSEHDGMPEWYNWVAQKVDGNYADATMKINFVSLDVDGDDYAGAVHAVEEEATHTMEGNCTDMEAFEWMRIPGCYNLVFNDNFFTSMYNMDMTPKEHEWAGIFDLHHGEKYTLTFSKVPVGGEYADATMKIVVTDAPGETHKDIMTAGPAADKMMAGECTEADAGATLMPGKCYELHFDATQQNTIYTLEMPAERRKLMGHDGHGAPHAVFMQHMPEEFECDDETAGCAHWIVDAEGNDVEAIVTDPEAESGHGHHDEHRMLQGHGGHDHGGGGGGHDGHGHGYFAIFAQHVPTEFELDSHYLKNQEGVDIEPMYEEIDGNPDGGGGSSGSSRNNRKKAWRNSMLACLAVLACTTVGAFIRAGLAMVGLSDEKDHEAFCILAGAFAVGCLLATSYFLIFVEAVHLTGARWKVEAQSTWRFGTMALLGYLVGMLSTMCEDLFHHPGHGHVARQQSLKKQAENEKAVAEAKEDTEDVSHGLHQGDLIDHQHGPGSWLGPRPINWGFVFVIFFGDFLHNFVDGIFIANAFLDCSVSKGWTIAGATVAHEIAQETSDFFLLITEGGLNTLWALIINGISGISIFIGAAVYLATKPGNGTRGLVLAFSGGIYVYIAATEAAACFTHKKLSCAMKLAVVFLFIVGAVAIGLVLLDHEHCEGQDQNAGDGGHAGHHH